MQVYIAGPFFNTEQREVIEGIEEELRNRGIAFFSPRLCGVLGDVAPEDRAEESLAFYEKNLEMLKHCEIMIAVVDDFDPGTMFEWGYFTKKKNNLFDAHNKLVSFSPRGYALNLMLTHSSDCHVTLFASVGSVVSRMIQGSDCSAFNTMREAVT